MPAGVANSPKTVATAKNHARDRIENLREVKGGVSANDTLWPLPAAVLLTASLNANTNRPQVAPHFLEVERRMKGILLPEAVGPGCTSANITGELAIGPPKIKARNAWDRHDLVPGASSSSRIVSSGTVRPASQSARADAVSPASFPAAASAESWRSHSSSTAGWSIDISSQYSCGERRSMAALISRSDVIWLSLPEQQNGPEVLRMNVGFHLQMLWPLSTVI